MTNAYLIKAVREIRKVVREYAVQAAWREDNCGVEHATNEHLEIIKQLVHPKFTLADTYRTDGAEDGAKKKREWEASGRFDKVSLHTKWDTRYGGGTLVTVRGYVAEEPEEPEHG